MKGSKARVNRNELVFNFDMTPRFLLSGEPVAWATSPSNPLNASADHKHFRIAPHAVKFESETPGTRSAYTLFAPAGFTQALDMSKQRFLEVWRRISHGTGSAHFHLQLWFSTSAKISKFWLDTTLPDSFPGTDEFYQVNNEHYFTLDRENPGQEVNGGVEWDNVDRIWVQTELGSGAPDTVSVTLDDLRYKEPLDIGVVRAEP
jgi:hypothetical protein